MIAKVVMFIAIFIIVFFMAYLMFTKEPLNKAYIKYIIFAYPFLGIDLLPSILSFNIFDFITLVYFIFFYSRHQTVNCTRSHYSYVWPLFLISLALGIFFSEDITRDTITSVIQLLTIYLFVSMLYRELMLDAFLKKEIVSGFRYLLSFSFIFLFLQYIIGPSFSFAKSENINVAGGAAIRYPSFFQDPQKYAQFLAALSFVVLVNVQNVTKNQKLFSVLLSVFSICALLLSGGRAGLGGWFVGLILLISFSSNVYRIRMILLLVTIALFAFFYQDNLSIFKRADLQDSYIFRQLIWLDALQIHQQHPWVGIGIGNYANYVSVHHPDQFWIHNNEITFFDHPESGYLKLLVEFGRIGFVFFSMFLLLPLYNGFKAYNKSRQIEHIFYLAAILSWMIGFYTVYSFGDIRIKVLIALIIVLSVSASQRELLLSNKRVKNYV